MRDNFAKGIYPTLAERQRFATEACDYVEQQLQFKTNEEGSPPTTVVSFSFVNNDLRDIFRQRFPQTRWVLIDTNEEAANVRIQRREGHFYKGSAAYIDKSGNSDDFETQEPSIISRDETHDEDNLEWQFAPVEFEHVRLDGEFSQEENAQKLLEIILKATP